MWKKSNKRHLIVLGSGVLFAGSIILGIYITAIYLPLFGLLSAAAIGGIAYFKEQ